MIFSQLPEEIKSHITKNWPPEKANRIDFDRLAPIELWRCLNWREECPHELLAQAHRLLFDIPETKNKLREAVLSSVGANVVCKLCTDIITRDGHHDDDQLLRIASCLLAEQPPVRTRFRIKEILDEVPPTA